MELNMNAVFENAATIFNALLPLAGMMTGLSLGFAIVNMLVKTIKNDFGGYEPSSQSHIVARDLPPEPAKPPVYHPIIETQPAPKREVKVDPNICPYCGQRKRPGEFECRGCGNRF